MGMGMEFAGVRVVHASHSFSFRPSLRSSSMRISAPNRWPLLGFAAAAALAGCSTSPADPEPQMELSPPQADLEVGEVLSISAALMGLANAALTWESDCGALDATGTVAVLTARWAPTDCQVTARSVANPTVSAATQIRIHPVAAADNLLAPGTFDQNLAPFAPVAGQEALVRWSADDARGAAHSGAARLTHPLTGDDATLVVMDYCFTPVPGAEYRLGGQARLVLEQPGAQVRVSARTFSQGCVLFEEYLGHGSFAVGSAAWDAGAFTFRAPVAGNHPVRITVGIQKALGVDATVEALVDDLFLVRID